MCELNIIDLTLLFAGDQPEIPTEIPLAAPGPQPMGALQHETMMHQQLAAAVAAQQSMGAEGLPGPRVPQPGMSPQQQQQVLAAQLQQMQAQQSKCIFIYYSMSEHWM